MLKKIQEQKRILKEQAESDSLMLLDGDFDMVTGARDNSDLSPEMLEKMSKKNEATQNLPIGDDDYLPDDEDMYDEAPVFSSDSTEMDSVGVSQDTVIHLTSKIDSVLLQQQIAELEQELENIREINELEKSGKGRKGKGKKKEFILERIKIPNCRYLNDVIYVRDKFEFRYELDFFVHYFDHRYFHKRSFMIEWILPDGWLSVL